jgi:TctA family transporter
VIIGGINTSNMFFSIIALYAVGKTRTGTAAAIKQLVELQADHLLLIAAACLVAIGVGAIASTKISSTILDYIQRINYKRINQAVLALVVALVLLFSNSVGVLAFATAIAISFTAISIGVKRSNCMAFLMVPTILFYLQV